MDRLKLLFLRPDEAFVSHATDAPVICIQFGEIGWWPVHTRATPERLNDEPVSESVKDSAILGSMVGWSAPGAREACEFFRTRSSAPVNAVLHVPAHKQTRPSAAPAQIVDTEWHALARIAS